MFDRFTEAARTVMALARKEAEKAGHGSIGSGHLLLGLAREGSGVAAQVLKNLDVDIRKARAEVKRLVVKGGLPGADGRPRLTLRIRRILQRALGEAREFGQETVATEHLLLGLLREREGVAAHALRNLGVAREDLRVQVLELLGIDPPGAEQEEARALVESILLKRLHHAESVRRIAGSVDLDVLSSHGPKGWGFQLWLGHRTPEGELRTEMAFWVAAAPTLEEHFGAVLDAFLRLVLSDDPPAAPPSGS